MKKIASIALLMTVLAIPFIQTNPCSMKRVKGATVIQKGDQKTINHGSMRVYCKGPVKTGFSVNA